MRPLSLRIEGLRSFRAPEEIDFGGRNQIALVGHNGAGKSSILEAMTYALYGKTSAGQGNQELMNDTSDKMRVVLRFRVSRQEWDVVRTLQRDGKGHVKPSGVRLRLLGKDGKPLELVEQVRAVNERVKQLIGLDWEAFRRTVVLPQGRFAMLLEEDQPTERSKVLRQLWPTEDLEAVGDLASQAVQDVAETRASLEGAHMAGEYPEDPEAHLAQLDKDAASAREKADAASVLAEEASLAFNLMEAAVEEGKRASTVSARLEPGLSQIEEAQAKVAPIAEVRRDIDKADDELRRKQRGLRAEIARIPSEDGPDQREVATALAALRSFGGLAATAVDTAIEMRQEETAARGKREAAGQAKEVAENAEKKAERHAQLRPPLDEADEAARNRREEAVLAHQKCDGLKRRAAQAQEKVGELAAGRDGLAIKAKNAVEEARRTKAAAKEAEERLTDARRANSAVAAAHGLHPGDDCPVCRRGLPEGWSPPEDGGLAEAEAAAQKAQYAAQESDRQSERARAELQLIEKQLMDAKTCAEQARTEYRTEYRSVAAAFGDGSVGIFGATDDISDSTGPDPSDNVPSAGAPPPLPSLDSLLGPLEAACKKASDALARHNDEHKALEKRASSASEDALTAEGEAKGANDLAAAARRNASDALARLAGNVDATPSPYRPAVELPGNPAELDEIKRSAADGPIAAAEERQRVLGHREQQRRRFSKELEKVAEKREDLRQRRDADVEQPLSEIGRPLGRHRDTVLRAVGALGLGDELGAATDLPGKDPAAYLEWIKGLGGLTSTVIEAAGKRAEEAAAAERAARSDLEEMGRRVVAQHLVEDPSGEAGGDGGETQFLDAPEAPVAPQAVVRAARSASRLAASASATTADNRDNFASIKDNVLALRALLDEAGRLERTLSDLDKALKPGAFLKWLTLRRSRSLLIQASRMLDQISGGKYSFADPGNDEGQWRVLDNESGQPRSPAGLSGGEKFIASLALALGMVEMMARSGGQLEALFVDEGFGSLDRSNLDAAVEALGTVAASGRMVGVISHVRAVAEQINDVLEVERTASGSRAKWLSRDQRRGMSRSDAEWTTSTAIEGLLE